MLHLVRLGRLFHAGFLVQLQTADHKASWVVVVGVTSGSISAPSRLVYHEHELPQVRNLAWWNASCTGYLDRAQGMMMPGVAVRWCRATPTVPMRKHLSSLFVPQKHCGLSNHLHRCMQGNSRLPRTHYAASNFHFTAVRLGFFLTL